MKINRQMQCHTMGDNAGQPWAVSSAHVRPFIPLNSNSTVHSHTPSRVVTRRCDSSDAASRRSKRQDHRAAPRSSVQEIDMPHAHLNSIVRLIQDVPTLWL